MAGIAAMVLTGILGTAMGLNNTGTFMSSCVAFVAVAMWADSQITRRRHETAQETARTAAGATARETGGEEAGGAASSRSWNATSGDGGNAREAQTPGGRSRHGGGN